MQIGYYHHPLPLTAVFASLCGLLLVYFTVKVIKLRWKHKQSIGVIETEEYTRKNGVLTNYANTTPIVLVLFAVAEVGKANCGMLFFIGGMYLLARIAHAHSVYVYEIKHNSFRLRMFGMITTFAVILALCAINLYIAACYI